MISILSFKLGFIVGAKNDYKDFFFDSIHPAKLAYRTLKFELKDKDWYFNRIEYREIEDNKVSQDFPNGYLVGSSGEEHVFLYNNKLTADNNIKEFRLDFPFKSWFLKRIEYRVIEEIIKVYDPNLIYLKPELIPA